jgi:hypothetical protein
MLGRANRLRLRRFPFGKQIFNLTFSTSEFAWSNDRHGYTSGFVLVRRDIFHTNLFNS